MLNYCTNVAITFRCHSGFVPPRKSSRGTNSLADTFRRKEYASVHIPPDNLRDRVNVPARANVPPSKMCYYTSQFELFGITGFLTRYYAWL